MANITAKLTQTQKIISANVKANDEISITQYRVSPSSFQIQDMADVDSSEPENGAMLQYNPDTEKYEARNHLQNAALIINGGNF